MAPPADLNQGQKQRSENPGSKTAGPPPVRTEGNGTGRSDSTRSPPSIGRDLVAETATVSPSTAAAAPVQIAETRREVVHFTLNRPERGTPFRWICCGNWTARWTRSPATAASARSGSRPVGPPSAPGMISARWSDVRKRITAGCFRSVRPSWGGCVALVAVGHRPRPGTGGRGRGHGGRAAAVSLWGHGMRMRS
jgi:hypothetical protein